MPPAPFLLLNTGTWGQSVRRTGASWWHMVRFGAVVLALVLSPSTYNPTHRANTARHIYTSTWEVLPWFTAMSALFSLVLIRVVVVTALSYGLSQYALQMVVRVLVLELIPLSAALFVALRAGMAFNAGAVLPSPTASASTAAQPMSHLSLERLRTELVPQVLASAFAVLTLAMVSSVMALVLAYVMVYGLSPWGLPGYTRTVGQVFDVSVTLGFALKTFFFSLAVAVVPMAASLEVAARRLPPSNLQPGAVRLFVVLFCIEAGSLAIKYI